MKTPKEIEAERAAFEAWASEGGAWPKGVERSPAGGYRLAQTQSHWNAWLARASIRPAQAAEPADTVRIPTNADEAALMANVAIAWLQLHAPEKLRTAPQAAEERKPLTWQPIETAPKDGTPLLLWEEYSTNPFVGWWSGNRWTVSHEHVDAEGGWDGAIVVDKLSSAITHWAPLLAPPAHGIKED